LGDCPPVVAGFAVRKHRAPKGALRRCEHVVADPVDESESTERQKVH